MTTIPTIEPTSVVAGDTVKWTKALTDYLPADSWVLSYVLVSLTASITITASDNGDGSHLVSEAAATTDDWTPGEYTWNAFVTKGAERYRVGDGRLKVEPNFQIHTTSGFDGRSHVKRTLDLIEAAIEGQVPDGMESFTIAGRAVSLMPLSELRAARAEYASLYARELRRQRRTDGKASASRIGVRF